MGNRLQYSPGGSKTRTRVAALLLLLALSLPLAAQPAKNSLPAAALPSELNNVGLDQRLERMRDLVSERSILEPESIEMMPRRLVVGSLATDGM